jgi:UDP-N-acetylglucosamine 2-epimerase (non-hydrolysing)
LRVATIYGTRPEIIRLSRVIALLDQHCEHLCVHTGQNYDPNLSDVFFQELAVRKPDAHWSLKGGGYAEQIGEILSYSAAFFADHKPDRVLILGDTNSGLSAIVAARMGIPVYHMEAGNRCYDDRVPEEINRRIIDSCSTVLMPYTHRSKENLLAEGYARNRIFVTGNPIFEVLEHYKPQIQASDVLQRMGLEEGKYFAVTLHRAENVDDPARLARLLKGLDRIAERWQVPVVVSFHPRTRDKLQKAGLKPASAGVRLETPMGFFDFVRLESSATCVLTDSGTVQEEAAILKVPSVIVRDVTERAEAIECGSGILSGSDPEEIEAAVGSAIAGGSHWEAPAEYLQTNVSHVVSNVVLGYR